MTNQRIFQQLLKSYTEYIPTHQSLPNLGQQHVSALLHLYTPLETVVLDITYQQILICIHIGKNCDCETRTSEMSVSTGVTASKTSSNFTHVRFS
jgi:hypothetical protein